MIDDEEFEAKLAAIIERDYFPDVKGLQNRLEWSEAAESNDPDKMANAQRNIVLRRAGFSVRIPPNTMPRQQSRQRLQQSPLPAPQCSMTLTATDDS